VGRKSITGGVMPAGVSRIRFDFSINGRRFRPTLPWIPNETNLRRARTHLTRLKAQIEAGTFCFADEFPRYRGLQKLPRVLQSRSCGEVFDDFLRHEEARLARGDLATATVARIESSSTTFGVRTWTPSPFSEFDIRCCLRSPTPEALVRFGPVLLGKSSPPFRRCSTGSFCRLCRQTARRLTDLDREQKESRNLTRQN
jgi:hypothetical protein